MNKLKPAEKRWGDLFKFPGRMLSATKTAPKGHDCVWNANIYLEDGRKIWYGDLDLTADVEDLQWFADDLGQPIFILREMDGRFLRPGKAVELDRAVAVYIPKE